MLVCEAGKLELVPLCKSSGIGKGEDLFGSKQAWFGLWLCRFTSCTVSESYFAVSNQFSHLTRFFMYDKHLPM